MVEIKCQENDAVKLPNNIRQVGAPGEKLKIYIEDYVMTYLNQVACQKPIGQKAAVLLGEAVKKDKTDIFFISAAIHMEHAEIHEDSLQLTTEMWADMYEKTDKYFKDKHILGWFLSRPGQSVGINGWIEKIQAEQFKDKGIIFYTMDPLDREDAFYLYENGQLIRQQGYYIYYERNEAMQNYMIEMRQDGAVEKQRETTGFQNRLFERKTDNQIKKEAYDRQRGKRSRWVPQAAAVLLVLLIVAAVRKNMMAGSVSANRTISPPTAASVGETNYSGNLDIVESIMQQAAETVGNEENETETKLEIETEDSGQNENEGNTEVAAGAHQSYTVKEGDTLLKISRNFYQDAEHVEEIIRMNQIEDPDFIFPGMVLQLP
ncbi:MAG: LysM peptidoglycan-binding domain-containing protein [Coprococcus sp.]